jgi:hypothetical protein
MSDISMQTESLRKYDNDISNYDRIFLSCISLTHSLYPTLSIFFVAPLSFSLLTRTLSLSLSLILPQSPLLSPRCNHLLSPPDSHHVNPHLTQPAPLASHQHSLPVNHRCNPPLSLPDSHHVNPHLTQPAPLASLQDRLGLDLELGSDFGLKSDLGLNLDLGLDLE